MVELKKSLEIFTLKLWNIYSCKWNPKGENGEKKHNKVPLKSTQKNGVQALNKIFAFNFILLINIFKQVQSDLTHKLYFKREGQVDCLYIYWNKFQYLKHPLILLYHKPATGWGKVQKSAEFKGKVR